MLQLKNKTYFSIFLIIIFLGIVGFLAFKYIAPFGKIVSYQFSQRLPGLKEANRIEGENESIKLSSQIINNSISRLTLKIDPKNIENIKVASKFKPGQKEIKIGVRSNEKDAFYYQPLYFSILRDLNWSNIQENDLTLWQRNKDFNSVSDFIQNPPKNKKIAFYMVNPDKLLSIKPIKENDKTQTIISNPLRGNHSLYIMVTQKPLEIKIAKQDTNAYDGPDKLKITLSRGQKLLIEKTIADDGITDKSRLQSLPQEEEIKIDEALPGIYKLNLNFESVGSDSLITKIEINQKKAVFKGNLFILGENPTALFTNSSKIDISTPHETYLQTVILNDEKKLEIKEAAKKINFDLEKLAGELKEGELYKLTSPKNDLNISGDGYFSFSKEAFFYPEIIKSIDISGLDNQLEIYDGFDYILTSLPVVKQDGEWLVSEVNIDPKDINIDGDTLYFSLEIPDLDKYGGSLEIDSFEVMIKNKGFLESKITPTLTPTPTSINTTGKAEAKPAEKNFLQKTGNFFSGVYLKIKYFFINSYQRLLPKGNTNKPVVSPQNKAVVTPTPTPTSTPTPSSKLQTGILIKVLNGGAGKGKAKEFADKIKNLGFSNVNAGNADKTDYQDATISYLEKNQLEMEKIATLLLGEYKTINKNKVTSPNGEITVILGER